jgi:hypothetical protein
MPPYRMLRARNRRRTHALAVLVVASIAVQLIATRSAADDVNTLAFRTDLVSSAADQIPAFKILHTSVAGLSEWQEDHGRYTVRAKLKDGVSVLLEYREDHERVTGIQVAENRS